MTDHTRRIAEMLHRTGEEAARIESEMRRQLGEGRGLDQLGASEFINVALCAARRVESAEPDGPARAPLPSRVDQLLDLADRLERGELANGERNSAECRAKWLAAGIFVDSGPDAVITRGGRALVSGIGLAGGAVYATFRHRDLDLEEWHDRERAAVAAASAALGGGELDPGQFADLIGLIVAGTDATEREAHRVVLALEKLAPADAPRDAAGVILLAGNVLESLRADLRPGRDRPAPAGVADRSAEAEAARLGRVPPEVIEAIAVTLETGVLEPKSALDEIASLSELEAGIVLRLALVGLEAARNSSGGSIRD